MEMPPFEFGKTFRCTYTNWKGETARRTLRPISIRYGMCEPWHTEPTWLMYAVCLDKAAPREFDMSKMSNVEEI